jgi:hypothetical protein
MTDLGTTDCRRTLENCPAYRKLLTIVAIPFGLALAGEPESPRELPPKAVMALANSLEAASAHRHHVWRDLLPTNAASTA